MTTPSKAAIYNEIKETAWRLFVFRKAPQTEVGYGRLACECPTLGTFLASYTADLGDDEADGYDAEKEAKLAQESSDEENPKKRCKTQTKKRTKKNIAWREEQDAAWIKDLVERPGTQFIYQMPHLQTQTVCFGGLTKFRITVLREFQKAAKLFEYTEPVFSGSPAGRLEDLVRDGANAAIPHGLTDQLDPFTWEHYRTPVNESLCVYWHYLPLNRFNAIPCGHAPGETFHGAASQICQENLLKIQGDWRQQLAMATNLCMTDDYTAQKLEGMKDLLRATYPLKLVYVSDAGDLRHAENLEACRATMMEVMWEAKYPLNPQKKDNEHECDLECDEEYDDEDESETKRLDVQYPPRLDIGYPEWLQFISGGGPKPFKYECELCPRHVKRNAVPQQFTSWQDYVGSNWQHMCEEHGPLGANSALTEVPRWIQNYIWRNADRKTPDLIFGAIAKAGFTDCGQMEQGTWKILPGWIVF